MMNEKKLKDLREKVEAVDMELLKGFNERARICLEIGKWKAQNGLDIDDPGREKTVFSYLAAANSGPLGDREIKEIFQAVFAGSKRLQSARGQESGVDKPLLSQTFTGNTKLYCILGSPVGHSMSPLMHNHAFKILGLDAVYLPFEVGDLARAVKGLRALGVRGASVTVPFKEEVMGLVDEIDETAEVIGAVNTLVFDGDHVRGTNTDWIGALRCLESIISVSGRSFVVIGAGGAARALVYAIVRQGGDVVVVNRSEAKGRALADDFSASFVPLSHLDTIEGDCLINTTPIGMHPRVNVTPVKNEILGRYKAVADVVYNPMKTKLLQEAEAAGCAIASGFEMFVYQGVEQFQIWTGRDAPVEEMRRVVYERLTKE